MRTVLITLAIVALVAGLSFAEFEGKRVYADFSTASLASNKVSTAVLTSGEIKEITLIPSGTYTSKVEIYITPTGASTPIYVYTNYTLTAETTVRPRVDTTDNAGTALTGDDPVPYIIKQGTLTVDVTNVNKTASTDLTVLITTEK